MTDANLGSYFHRNKVTFMRLHRKYKSVIDLCLTKVPCVNDEGTTAKSVDMSSSVTKCVNRTSILCAEVGRGDVDELHVLLLLNAEIDMTQVPRIYSST